MPYWLHNTLFAFLIIITFGCVTSRIEWKKKPGKANVKPEEDSFYLGK